MSSNIRILKACEYCKSEYIAKTTVSKTCSDNCAKRLYKLKQRTRKIEQVMLKEEIKRKPQTILTEAMIRTIQAKENLTLIEAAVLLNITPLTLRRWILSRKITSHKVGKKHIIRRIDIFDFIVDYQKVGG